MNFIDILLHIDQYVGQWLALLGPWMYVLMFLIIFAETGLVVTPFLPGDSLLFALGVLTVSNENPLNIWILSPLLMAAALIGDNVNYTVGRWLGPRVFRDDQSRYFKRQHLVKTQSFYEKFGPKAVILARFAPIIRTFVPFVAGVGAMKRSRFIGYSIIGAILWINGFLFAGHFFGTLPGVKRNFHLVILAIICLSLLPIVIEFFRQRALLKKGRAASI